MGSLVLTVASRLALSFPLLAAVFLIFAEHDTRSESARQLQTFLYRDEEEEDALPEADSGLENNNEKQQENVLVNNSVRDVREKHCCHSRRIRHR